MNLSQLGLGALLLCAVNMTAADMLGFDPESEALQRQLEKQFDRMVNAEDLEQWMRHLSARPNHLGSEYGRQNAEYLKGLFESWGFDTRIETYSVLFPTPKSRLLQMVYPYEFRASLEEPTLKEDPYTAQKDEQLPTYNAYSIDGDVTGTLVYVNYGLPEDYEELARRGITVDGKIVIARYFGSWRGIKPKVAAEQGAIATIIYSDPKDDGYTQGDPYPYGGYRSAGSVQRGSVMDMPLHPGDPLTPGIGATKDAPRLDLADVKTLTSIPVIPISYEDARPLLESLRGPLAPPAWRGGLDIAYHLGAGPTKVRIVLKFNWNQVELHNVIAVMAGEHYPDQWIIRGNHRDAWVNGAADPMSGLVAMLAEAKAVGALSKAGSKPDRTIVYAAWDGEEQGLLGSTEWGEHHGDELKSKVISYINTDSTGRGFLRAGGSHSLERLVNQVASDIMDPEVGVSVADRLRAEIRLSGSAQLTSDILGRPDLKIAPLGSGSDYTTFLQHLGIASLNLGYSGESDYGVYHSIYDTMRHYTLFMDPGFRYGVTLAKTAGRLTLRLAEAPRLPFRFGNMSDHVATYVSEIEQLADHMREETTHTNQLINDGVYLLGLDPLEAVKAPKLKKPVPHLDFSALKNATTQLAMSAKSLDDLLQGLPFTTLTKDQRLDLNQRLFRAERLLTAKEGLPRRDWYRHYIYAPGFYTGYGVKTLPAVREALESRNWSEMAEQQLLTAKIITGYASHLDDLATLVSGFKAAAEAANRPGVR